MKAVLVLDEMPKGCGDCDLFYDFVFCTLDGNLSNWDRRPDGCPLKPLPRFTDMIEENTALGIFDGTEPAWEAGASYGWGEYQRQLLNPKKEEDNERD